MGTVAREWVAVAWRCERTHTVRDGMGTVAREWVAVAWRCERTHTVRMEWARLREEGVCAHSYSQGRAQCGARWGA
jgi:hypothetical protein